MTDFKVEAAFGSDYRALHFRSNPIGDGSFENGMPSLPVGSMTLTRSTEWASHGDYSLKMVPTTAGVNDTRAGLGGDVGGMRLGMVAGGTYTIAGTVYTPVAQTGALNNNARSIVFYYRIGTGSYIQQKSAAGPVTGQARLSLTFTVPVGATEAFVRIYNGADNSSTNAVYWDELVMDSGPTVGGYIAGNNVGLPGPADASWFDISDCVTSVKARRGRNNEFDEIETGTVSVSLDNADGRFTPMRVPNAVRTNIIAGGFSADSNADGIADGWVAYVNGTTGTVTRSLVAGAQRIQATALGATSQDRAAVRFTTPYTNSGVVGGATTNMRFDLKGTFTTGQTVFFYCDYRDASTAIVGNHQWSVPAASITTSFQTFTGPVLTVPATAVQVNCYLWVSGGGTAGAADLYIENAILEHGTTGAFFDGNTPRSGTTSYGWVGTANASASVMYEPNYYPYIVPGVPIRVTASADGWQTAYPVAYGYAERWPLNLDNLSTVELSATDAFALFAKSKLAEPAIAENLRGARIYLPLTTQEYGYGELVSNTPVTVVNSDNGPATIAWESSYPNPRIGDNGAAGWTLTTATSTVGTLLKIPYTPYRGVLDGSYYGGGIASFWWTPDARAAVTNATTQNLLSLGTRYGVNALGVAGVPGYSFGDGVVRVTEGKPVFIQARWAAVNASTFQYQTYVSSEQTNWLPVLTDSTSGTIFDASPYIALGAGPTLSSPFLAGAASGSFRHLRVMEAQGATPSVPTASVSPEIGDDEVTQLQSVCTWVGFPISATDFDAPKSTRLALDGAADESALTYLKGIAEDAGGLLWVAPDGRLRYRNRHARSGSTVVRRFTNADSTNPEPGLNAYVDDSHIVNVATVKYPGTVTGATYVATDQTSVNKYGRSPVDIDSLVISDLERADRANDLLTQYDAPVLRVEGVSFDAAAFPNAGDLLGLEIGDRILLEFPPAAPFPSAEYFIEGVEIDAQAAGTIPTGTISFDLSPASAATRWVLESPTLGALDSAVLAY